jgi:hypothetical protein
MLIFNPLFDICKVELFSAVDGKEVYTMDSSSRRQIASINPVNADKVAKPVDYVNTSIA